MQIAGIRFGYLLFLYLYARESNALFQKHLLHSINCKEDTLIKAMPCIHAREEKEASHTTIQGSQMRQRLTIQGEYVKKKARVIKPVLSKDYMYVHVL